MQNLKKQLRWKYGLHIEDKTLETRKKDIYKTLMFHNTLIKKTHFQNIKFDSTLKDYGHDDTVFSYQVSLENLKVKHIDNPVEHGDIDDSNDFLRKTREGILNLHKIYYSKKVDYKFIKLLNFYSKLEKFKLTFIISFFYRVLKISFEKQLLSTKPSLLLFNFYKIGYLCNLKK